MILGVEKIMQDPQFVGPFTRAESSLMRDVYLLAESGFSATHLLDEKTRYALASVVLYICSCEKREQPLENCDREAMANEALEVLLSMPHSRMQMR